MNAYKLQTKSQPTIGNDIREIEDQVLVYLLFHGLHKALLGFEGANGRDARERLAEMGEYGRFTGRLESFQLTHRGHKVALNEHVNDHHWEKSHSEPWCRVDNDEHGEENVEHTSTQALERLGYGALSGVNVLGEAVDNATGRRGLEELHGASQYRVEHRVVQETRCSNAHQQEDEVGKQSDHALSQTEHQVDQKTESLAIGRFLLIVARVIGPQVDPVVAGHGQHVAHREEENVEAEAENAARFEVGHKNGPFDLDKSNRNKKQ